MKLVYCSIVSKQSQCEASRDENSSISRARSSISLTQEKTCGKFLATSSSSESSLSSSPQGSALSTTA
eukprot:scaffold18785_cov118-Skeletonema_marinoi.AAC.2